MYGFVHARTILTIGRSINLFMQGLAKKTKHKILRMAIYPCMNIQDLSKGLLTSFHFAIRILMVMELGVSQHVR